MNAIVMPSVGARAEIAELSSMTNWTRSYQSGDAHFKPIQDSITGAFQLTRSSTRIDMYRAQRYFNNTTIKPDFSAYAVDHLFTGREILSLILPTFNYSRRTRWYNDQYKPYIDYDDKEKHLRIENGVILEGVFDKGAAAIYGEIEIIHGGRAALDAMFDVQQLAIEHTSATGFTTGFNDILLPPETFIQLRHIVSNILVESELIAQQLMNNDIIPPLGMTVEQHYEGLQKAVLRADAVEPIMKAINPNTNGLFTMIATESKGAWPNLQQMLAFLGQINIKDQRIRQIFSFKRTSHYFQRFDLSAESRGFIASSYLSGLSPSEYVFSATSARIDLIGKSLVGTSLAGEQARINIKNLESNVINNTSLMEKSDFIVQMMYGDDGFDPRNDTQVKFATVAISNDALKTMTYYTPTNVTYVAFFAIEYATLIEDRDHYRRIFLSLEGLSLSYKFNDTIALCINVASVYRNAIAAAGTTQPVNNNEQTLVQMCRSRNEFCDTLCYIYTNIGRMKALAYVPIAHQRAVRLIQTHIRGVLHARALMVISPATLQGILEKIRLDLRESIVEYGAPFGMISAACISEPITQLALDSIHLKDPDRTIIKSGLWRIKEVLGARPTENCRQPMMMMKLQSATPLERAREIANKIEMMNLRQFVYGVQIFYEEYGQPVHPDYLHEVALFAEYHAQPVIVAPTDVTRWCTRITLDRYNLIIKNMTLAMIVNKLRSKDRFIVHSNENAPEIVIRVYYKVGFNAPSTLQHAYVETEQLLNQIIRGVNGVVSATVDRHLTRHILAPDGSIINDAGRLSITTNGVNITDMYYLQHEIPEIDWTTLQTDSIRSTESVFGLDAARLRIIAELRSLLSLSSRHFSTFASEMTSIGRVTAIERNALNARNSNPLLQMANASHRKALEKAVFNMSKAKIDNVSAHLMVGTAPRLGSTYNTCYVNSDFVIANMKSATTVLADLLD